MYSCKKDPPILLNHGCVNLDFTGCNISLAVNYYDSTQFKTPSINPNNPNEFVYYYTNSNKQSLNGLYKYEITTGLKTPLITGLNLLAQPKWGKNGWILFNVINGDDREIYKVKSNGDSITKLTSFHPDLFPEWNSDATRIIFNRAIYLAAPQSKIFIADINGSLTDSIDNQYFFYGACNGNNELAYPPFFRRNYGITTLNFISKNETTLYNPPADNTIQGITWHPNNDEVYFTTLNDGLYKVSKLTKKLTLIKQFCTSKSYGSISMSPDASFILAERIDARVYNCAPYYKSSIYKLSLDGKIETKITLE